MINPNSIGPNLQKTSFNVLRHIDFTVYPWRRSLTQRAHPRGGVRFYELALESMFGLIFFFFLFLIGLDNLPKPNPSLRIFLKLYVYTSLFYNDQIYIIFNIIQLKI
jgi:hypothetical protein